MLDRTTRLSLLYLDHAQSPSNSQERPTRPKAISQLYSNDRELTTISCPSPTDASQKKGRPPPSRANYIAYFETLTESRTPRHPMTPLEWSRNHTSSPPWLLRFTPAKARDTTGLPPQTTPTLRASLSRGTSKQKKWLLFCLARATSSPSSLSTTPPHYSL